MNMKKSLVCLPYKVIYDCKLANNTVKIQFLIFNKRIHVL